MTLRAELQQAARQLVIQVGGAPDDKAILSGDKGPKPAKPYVTVRVTSLGPPRGPAERVHGVTLDGDDPGDWSLALPNSKMRERREPTISLQGYGTGSAVWLDTLQINLDSVASLAVQAEHHVSALLQAPVTDLSALLDTAEEQRFSLELRLRHLYEGESADHVPLEQINVSAELQHLASDPDTLTADQVVVDPEID